MKMKLVTFLLALLVATITLARAAHDGSTAPGQLVLINDMDVSAAADGDFGVAADASTLYDATSKALLDNFHWLGDTFGGLANGSLVLPQLPEEIVRDIRAAYEKALAFVDDYRKDHPLESELLITAFIGIAITFLAPQLVLVVLRLFGWSARGVVLNSIAASIQSLYGATVPAGRLFAWLTSAAMRGYALRDIRIVAGVLGLVSAVWAALAKYLHGNAAEN